MQLNFFINSRTSAVCDQLSVSDQFSKIPEVSKSLHLELLESDHDRLS